MVHTREDATKTPDPYDPEGREHDGAPTREASSSGSAPRGRKALWIAVAVLIVAWLGLSSVGGPFFGRIGEVSSNDQSTFLPESAESTEAGAWLERFRESDDVPAIIVATHPDGQPVTDAQSGELQQRLQEAADSGLLAAPPSPPVPSADGMAVQVFAPVGPEDTATEITDLRAFIAQSPPGDLQVQVTGPAGFTADLAEGFAGIDGLLLIVALAVVFVILVIVYRSPLLPFLVLFTSMAALSASILIVWNLANAGVLTVNGQVQGILFILVVGATTDYSLLYVARFRNTLHTESSRLTAALAAVKGTVEPIAASGGTVIAGLLCLLLSDLASNSALGPVAAIGIVMAILAALTFLPALLALFGRTAFWPYMPKTDGDSGLGTIDESVDEASREQKVVGGGLWAKIARLVVARHRVLWIAMVVVLLIPIPAAFGFKASGVPQSEFVLGQSEARDGQQVLGKHFPQGSGTPVQIVVPETEYRDVVREIVPMQNIASLAITADGPTGSARLAADGEIAPPQQPGPPPGLPKVVDGRVVVEATLAVPADSAEAEQAVADIREAAHRIAPDALVGGQTAVTLDTNTSAVHDRNLIIPIILVVITLILMALLRSLLAPILLVALTVVSFGTALGVSAIVFNHILGFPGADPSVPLYAFVFLVALGIDYNIFLMSRVREESMRHGTRQGVLRGLVFTGGVITSAGIVLAATFAALAVIPIMFLAQLAFIVTFGVLLDAILVRSLLVPALTYDMGRIIWWPRHKVMR